jgi:hypothetical protein
VVLLATMVQIRFGTQMWLSPRADQEPRYPQVAQVVLRPVVRQVLERILGETVEHLEEIPLGVLVVAGLPVQAGLVELARREAQLLAVVVVAVPTEAVPQLG